MFSLHFNNVRPLCIVRAIAAVLAVVLLGNSVAFAAVRVADPVKLKESLRSRGIGKKVRVTEMDGTTVSGRLALIGDDTFQVAPNNGAPAATIAYSQVYKVRNGGMGVGAKIAIVAGCVLVAAGIAALVITSDIKNSPI
jgi:hypothetical protein